jgi:hypothetical protein
MTKQAVIGNPFVFQALFVGADNVAFDPAVGPTIDIFSFSTAGAKNPLVTGAAMTAVAPAETGRFVYVYAVPTTFSDGDTLYAEIRGEDALANELFLTDQVTLIAATRSGVYNNAGLTAHFVE